MQFKLGIQGRGAAIGVLVLRRSSLELSAVLVNASFVISQDKGIGGWGLGTGSFASLDVK